MEAELDGFVPPEDDDLVPLVSIETLELNASHGQGAVTAVAAASNCVLLGTATGALIRYDFAEGAAAGARASESTAPESEPLSLSSLARLTRTSLAEVELCKPGSGLGVHSIFCDASARHALVVLRDATGKPCETVYFHASWRKARPLPRLKACPPSAAAWRSDCGESVARDLILGSALGALYQLDLDASCSRPDVLFRPLLELRDKEPLRGLFQASPAPGGGRHKASLLALAVTSSRLYCVTGGPGLEAACAQSLQLAGGSVLQPLLDLPAKLPQSQLHVYGPPGRPPERFAWLGAQGVYHGSLEGAAEGAHALTPYPQPSGGGGALPVGFAPSQFHFLLLYPDRLVALNALSSRVATTLPLGRFGIGAVGASALALVPDAQGGALYLASSAGLFEVITKEEGRNQWRLHLARREYSQALACAPTPRDAERCHVAQGEACFSRSDFLGAATAFAAAPGAMPFEEAALRLLRCGDARALRAFLRARLDSLPRGDRAAATLLSTWLLELFLHSLASEKEPAPAAPQKADADAPPLADQLRAFLKEHAAVLDVATTRRLLSDFGRSSELVYFADLKGDSATVVEHHLAAGEAAKAVGVLRRPNAGPELLYTTAPPLFRLAPADAVDLWLAQAERVPLDPARFVPALAAARGRALGEEARAQAVRYLEHCCSLGVSAAGVHNLLLSLHAEGAQASEAPLLRYLRGAGGGGGAAPLYDPAFALRTCLQLGALRSAVELHVASGALDLAVDTALRLGDVDLA